MSKIIVVSDSHSLQKSLKKLYQIHADADLFIHCGDSELTFSELYEAGSFKTVKGNCDYETFEREMDLQINSKKIHIEHGDRFSNMQSMLYHAQEIGCDIFMSGHTHIPHEFYYENILFLNPGSLRQNRDGSEPSYMVVYIDGDEVKVKLIRTHSLLKS